MLLPTHSSKPRPPSPRPSKPHPLVLDNRRRWSRPARTRSTTSTATATVRGLILIAILLIAWRSTGPVLRQNGLNQFSQARLAKRDGDREVWMVQERWEHPGGVLRRASWPECARIMTLALPSEGSFADAVWLILRAEVLAESLGYVLLVDDTDWSVGTWRSLFSPLELQCEPPVDWAWPEAAVRPGKLGWEAHSRIWLSSDETVQVDTYLRTHLLDSSSLSSLRERVDSSSGTLLPGEETVPQELLPIFGSFSRALEKVWKLNDGVQMLILNERRTFHLGKGDSRGRSSGRPPIVSIQLGEMSEGEGERAEEEEDRRLKRALQAANLALDLLYTTSWQDAQTEETPCLLLSPTPSSTLQRLSSEALATSFVIETTTTPPPQSLLEWSEQLGGFGLEVSQLQAAGTKPVSTDEGSPEFRALPEKLKTHLVRLKIRDLEVAARYADAAVVSGASSLGRLACLLGGVDGVRGPLSTESGLPRAGRIRSADSFWFPTSTVDALFAE